MLKNVFPSTYWRLTINSSTPYSVEHHPDNSRFVVDLGAEQAVLTYKMLDHSRVDFNHTYVPDSARGKGIADILVKEGLAWARTQGLEILASCWYVSAKLD